MQLRIGSLFGFAILLTSASAMAQTISLVPRDDQAVVGNAGKVTIAVLKNDSSSDGKPVYLKKVGQPKFGTATIAPDPDHESHGQVIVYRAGPSFTGTDSFQYKVTNLAGVTATATVKILGPRYAMTGSVGATIDDPSGRTVGYLQLDAMNSGTFTGKIRIGLDEYSLRGSLNRNGRYTGVARGEDGDTLPVSLEVTQSGDVAVLTGTFDRDGEWTARQEIGSLTKDDFEEIEGRYTVELPPAASITTDEDGTVEDADDRDVPQGSGWMIVEVNDRGEARLKGRTGDGRSFSVEAQVGTDEGEPVLPFYEAWEESVLGGTLRMGEVLGGDLTWTRDESDEDRYPEGFDLRVAARGARYIEPEGGTRALASESSDAGRVTVTISGEGLEDFTRELRLSEDDEATDLESFGDPIDLEINRESGTFSGKYRDPDDRDVRVKFSGVLLQNEGRAVGLFEAKNKTGKIELQVKAEGTDDGDDTGTDLDPVPQPDVDPTLDEGGFFFGTEF